MINNTFLTTLMQQRHDQIVTELRAARAWQRRLQRMACKMRHTLREFFQGRRTLNKTHIQAGNQ